MFEDFLHAKNSFNFVSYKNETDSYCYDWCYVTEFGEEAFIFRKNTSGWFWQKSSYFVKNYSENYFKTRDEAKKDLQQKLLEDSPEFFENLYWKKKTASMYLLNVGETTTSIVITGKQSQWMITDIIRINMFRICGVSRLDPYWFETRKQAVEFIYDCLAQHLPLLVKSETDWWKYFVKKEHLQTIQNLAQ